MRNRADFSSQEVIKEQVRSASDIVEVVGDYIPLKRAGASYKKSKI
jgi:DNA primase